MRLKSLTKAYKTEPPRNTGLVNVTQSGFLAALIMSFLGAVVLLWIYRMMIRRRTIP